MPLTKAQIDFINSDAKFIRLLAPAGCGKTFSIVEKTKKILATNPKAKIKIFTFTTAAAEELRSRCPASADLDILTLNSWGNAYIRRKLHNPRMIDDHEKKFYVCNTLGSVWKKTAYKSRFEPILSGRKGPQNGPIILDRICDFKNIGFKHTDFSKDFQENLKIYDKHIEFIRDVKLDKYYRTIRASLVRLLMHKKKLNMTERDQDEFIVRHWIPFWKDCCEEMLNTDRFLFDDQKYIANLAIQEQRNRKEHWVGTAKLDYIFIDEFQDVSPLDLMLISNLQYVNDASLTIVGDDDQAIFEFRGATPYFILHPDEMFGHKFETFALDENFRSPKNIVEKSMLLIKNNKKRFDKSVSANPETKDAEIKLCESEYPEDMVDAVIADIKSTPKNENVVVLSRKKSSLLPYQILLTRDHIDYEVNDDLSFFYTSAAANLTKAIEIKQKKTLQPRDFVELVCMFTKNELWQKTKDTLGRAFVANYVTMDNIHEKLLFLGERNPLFAKLFTFEYVQKFYHALQSFRNAKTVYDTISILLNSFDGFHQNYFRALEDLYYKDPPLSSLLSFASKYGDDFDGFVTDFQNAIDRMSCPPELCPKSNVKFSTALRVKGQEFEKVIILDAIEGIWPLRVKANEDEDTLVLDDVKTDDAITYDFIDGELIQRGTRAPDSDEIESERRLFYVAVTRSKKSLHLYRTIHMTEKEESKISPFVTEGEYDK